MQVILTNDRHKGLGLVACDDIESTSCWDMGLDIDVEQAAAKAHFATLVSSQLIWHN